MKSQHIDHYLEQLQNDILFAIENKPNPFPEWQGGDEWAWISEEEDRRNAPVKSIAEWTGIPKDALPPHENLNDAQLEKLYEALSNMLNVYNMSIVFHLVNTQTRAKYQVLRAYYDQEQPMLRWHMGFFNECPDEKPFVQCLLGEKCHCRFFAEMRADFIDEDLSPEEERMRELDIEVRHIKRKHGDDWRKYYPYHLDPDYDDEFGNPYDYGFGDID